MQQVFSEEQLVLLTAVLNRIIPAEGDLPGAGDLGLSQFVAGAAAGSPASVRLFTLGLRQIDIASPKGKSFIDLSTQEQDTALKAVESSAPEFFQALVLQTYNGYYTHQQVLEKIGYAPHAPQRGEQPELLDERLLGKQRERAPFWTKV